MSNNTATKTYTTRDNNLTNRQTADKGTKNKKKYHRKAVNIGMAISLGASIIGALTGSKKTHIITGTIFMGFGALHAYRHKNNMF